MRKRTRANFPLVFSPLAKALTHLSRRHRQDTCYGGGRISSKVWREKARYFPDLLHGRNTLRMALFVCEFVPLDLANGRESWTAACEEEKEGKAFRLKVGQIGCLVPVSFGWRENKPAVVRGNGLVTLFLNTILIWARYWMLLWSLFKDFYSHAGPPRVYHYCGVIWRPTFFYGVSDVF